LQQVACGLSDRAFKFKLPSQVIAPGAAAAAAATVTHVTIMMTVSLTS